MDALNPNLAARLERLARAHPDRAAIVDWRGGRRRAASFGQLAERVASLAAGLEARGISRGDRVLLFVPMSLDLYVALLGVLHVGAQVVFVDAWAGRARLDAAVAAARPRALVAIPRASLLRLVSPALRAIPVALVAGGRWPLARLEHHAGVRPAVEVEPDDPALVTFTTGSTGTPKAAVRSHGFLWAQHEALAEELALRETDIDMPTLPVFVLNNLASGATSVIPDFDPRHPADIRPDAILQNIRAERVSTLAASPAFCERLAAACASRRETLPLRALFTGGAPVYPPLAQLLADTVEGTVRVLYGSTEAEPIAGIGAREMLAAHSALAGDDAPTGLSVGRPTSRIALRLIRAFDGPIALDAEGWAAWDVAPGATGEIVVAGDHVLRGYLDDPESDRANKIHEGGRVWHRTGDAGRLDAGGSLWLMGRIKGRVLRGGVEWWPLPAELRAMGVPGVVHAAYVGVAGGAGEMRAVLCVEAPGMRESEATRARFAEALAPWPVDAVRVLDRIPRDPRHQAKTDHEALMRRLTRRATATRGVA